MSDAERGFLAAILADPADDTARLVYADWLQEQGGRPERAEFIRLQIEIATAVNVPPGAAAKASDMLHRVRQGAPVRLTANTPAARLVREALALEKHREEWSRVACPACKRSGIGPDEPWPTESGARPICRTCAGTGNIGGLYGDWLGQVEFRRGFPHAMSVWLSHAFEERRVRCEACNGRGTVDPSRVNTERDPLPPRRCEACTGVGGSPQWMPTPLAVRWLTHHPIQEVRLIDRVPWMTRPLTGEPRFTFGQENGPGVEHLTRPENRLPAPLLSAFRLRGEFHSTADAANTALARAAADIILEAVDG